MQSILQNVLVGWLFRRAQELGGLVTLLTPIYLNMTPANQEAVQMILTGRGGGLSITVAIGLAVYLFGQAQSLLATIKPQVVTADGTKLTPKPNSQAQATIEAVAADAPRNKTLFEKLFHL